MPTLQAVPDSAGGASGGALAPDLGSVVDWLAGRVSGGITLLSSTACAGAGPLGHRMFAYRSCFPGQRARRLCIGTKLWQRVARSAGRAR